MSLFLPGRALGDNDQPKKLGKKTRTEAEEEGFSGYSYAAFRSSQDQLTAYGMVPIYGRDIAEGTYQVQAVSSSPFFKIRSASLRVEGEQMTLTCTIGSQSYLYVYPGTGLEAEEDTREWIPFTPLETGSSFTMEIPALNAPFDCAAYSKNRKRWYDRRILVDAASLPSEALLVPLPDYELIADALSAYEQTPEGQQRISAQAEQMEAAAQVEDEDPGGDLPPAAAAIALADGEYSVEVNMMGGSGRASVSSPTLLIVREGKAYARLLWSSAYYDYMLLEGARYENLTTDGGNSTFEIPITAFDTGIDVIADTTAMGDPVEINYTLTFYEDGIGAKSLIPQEAAKKVLVIALAIIVAGGVLNHFVKRRRR